MTTSALMLGPIYDLVGVAGAFVLADTSEVTITVLDKSSGVEVAMSENEIPTMVPAAVLRMTDLADAEIGPSDLLRATLTMNGVAWRVESYRARPTHDGEAAGEVFLFLTKAPA